MYSYFTQVNVIKVLIVFIIAQIAGSALAVGIMEFLPSAIHAPDFGFELLRAGPSILLILWFILDMRKNNVDIAQDFRMISQQIQWKDLLAILGFNVLIGLFSIYAIIYGVIHFLPADSLTNLSNANGISTQKTTLGVLFGAIGAIFFAPLAEEFIFRGFLFTKFQKKFSVWISIVLSSILFGAIHFSMSAITTFLFAVSLCIVFYKTKNLAIAIVLHILNNTLVSGLEVVNELFLKSGSQDLSITEISQQFYTVGLPCLLGSLLFAYYLIAKRDFLKLDKPFIVS